MYSYCGRFEPRSHFKSRLSLIVRVNVVLNKTVVVQSELYHVSWWYQQSINWRDTTNFDSEDDYRTGCRNVSHCQQQQSYSALRSPGRSNSTSFCIVTVLESIACLKTRTLYASTWTYPCVCVYILKPRESRKARHAWNDSSVFVYQNAEALFRNRRTPLYPHVSQNIVNTRLKRFSPPS